MDENYVAEEGEENVYQENTREDLLDNDELSPEEEAFMKGYDDSSEKKSEEAVDSPIASEEEEL